MTKLTEEQQELLKNYENIAQNLYSQKDYIGMFVLLNSVVIAKDLEAEQKVEEAVRKENERCALIAENMSQPNDPHSSYWQLGFERAKMSIKKTIRGMYQMPELPKE